MQEQNSRLFYCNWPERPSSSDSAPEVKLEHASEDNLRLPSTHTSTGHLHLPPPSSPSSLSPMSFLNTTHPQFPNMATQGSYVVTINSGAFANIIVGTESVRWYRTPEYLCGLDPDFSESGPPHVDSAVTTIPRPPVNNASGAPKSSPLSHRHCLGRSLQQCGFSSSQLTLPVGQCAMHLFSSTSRLS